MKGAELRGVGRKDDGDEDVAWRLAIRDVGLKWRARRNGESSSFDDLRDVGDRLVSTGPDVGDDVEEDHNPSDDRDDEGIAQACRGDTGRWKWTTSAVSGDFDGGVGHGG